MRHDALSWIWLVSLVCASTANAQWLVEDVGDPDTWQLRGVETFKPDDIRRALRFDFETLLAAHPRALLPELPGTIETRIKEGFLHVGFPDVKVKAAYDRATSKVEVVVQEGVRCVANEIVVTGVPRDLAQTVVKRLTESHLEVNDAAPQFGRQGRVLSWLGPDGKEIVSEEPLWKPGEPVAFDQESIGALEERVGAAWKAAGYYHVQFTCAMRTRDGVADFEISVKDLGAPATVREIAVVGNEVNTDEEIIRYVKIVAGMLFSTERRTQILHDLWQAGRFTEQHVQVEPVANGVRLKVAVVEAPKAPRLSEPLSREIRALLKCREWLVDGEGQKRDMSFLITHAARTVKLHVSGAGMFLAYRGSDVPPDSLPEFAMILSRDGIGIYEPTRQRKLLLSHPEMSIVLTSKLWPGEAESEKPFRFSFGASLSKSSKEAQERPSPLKVRLSAAPAFFVRTATWGADSAVWEDHVLTLRTPDSQTRIDERTGELLGYVSYDESEKSSVALVATEGAFEKKSGQLREASAGHRDHYDPAAPISSIVDFVCTSPLPAKISQLLGQSPQDADAMNGKLRVAHSLVYAGLLSPVDEAYLDGSKQDDTDKFSIPSSQPQTDELRAFIRNSIGLADDVFARNSWPWTVWREAAFAISGHPKHLDKELRRLLASDDLGPLGHWVLAELAAYAKNDSWAVFIAQIGATQLDLPGFRGDTEALLGKALPHLVPATRWLARLSQLERRDLADALSVDAEVIEKMVAATQVPTEEQAQRSFLDSLDQFWADPWQALVRQRLRKIVAERGPAALQAREKAARNR